MLDALAQPALPPPQLPPATGGAVRIALLGGFRLAVGNTPVPEKAWRLHKARSLVKLLALAPAQRLPRERAMDDLWPDLDADAAGNNLRGALHAARRALAPHAAISNQGGMLALAAEGGLWIDAVAFAEASVAAGRSGDLADYAAALELYAGELLPEDRYEDWATGRRDYLRGLYLTLLRDVAALHERAADWAAAITATQRLLVAEPADEAAHVALMRLHALAGRRSLALAHWDQLVATLRRELDAEPEAAARALRDQIADGRFPPDGAAPALATGPGTGRSRHNLPIPPTALIGREVDLAEVRDRLARHRLVTLTGAGGCGKTRLALAVATDRLAAHPDGVWFIDLAPLADPARVPGAVAEVLETREVPGTPLATTLAARLAGDAALLVLDNCEHLRDACATLAAALLAGCPRLHILATSRLPLGLAGEALWRVPSLRVPADADREHRPAELAAVPAVRLFVERVRGRRPTFALTAENGRAVAAITRRLDGIPLALELAAARVAMLTVEQLDSRLDGALQLLTGGSRAAAPRQQTLRATLEWSYHLLAPPQRALLERLSVFAGGCDLDAVEAVCADDGAAPDGVALPRAAILDELTTLAEHSLVQVEADGPVARYRLLETVRQFAAERLAGDAAADACRARHAARSLALAERETALFSGAEQGAAFARLDLDHDNLRAALAWSLAHGRAETGLRLAAALWMYWEARGHFAEGRRWFDALLALPTVDGVPPGVRAAACYGAGAMALRLGEHAPARARFADCLTLARLASDERRISRALNALGLLAISRGEYEAGLAHLGEAEALLRGLDDPSSLANVLNNTGLAHFNQGRHAEALPHFTEALAVAHEHHDHRTAARALSNLSNSSHYLGDEAGAAAYGEEFIAIARQLGDRYQIAIGLHNLGSTFLENDDLDRAAPPVEEALAIRREIGDKAGIASSLVALGQLCCERGEVDRATAAAEEGLALAREVNVRWLVAAHLVTLGDLALAQGRLLHAAHCATEALAETQAGGEIDHTFAALTLCARVAAARGDHDHAARLLAAVAAQREGSARPFVARDRRHAAEAAAAVESALPADAFAAAWAAGRALPLAEAIALALPPDRHN